MERMKLSDGNTIPILGYGTYKIQECPQGAEYCIEEALKAGYRHFDGADVYGNEELIGEALFQAIKDKRVKREDLFITSKVPRLKLGYESTIQCCLNSLEKMHLDYFDLYLIHDPYRASEHWKSYVIDTWRALEHLVQEGKVKSIGVSNFGIKHLEYLLPLAKIKPVINQIEVHPQHQQRELVAYCKKHNIAIEAWGTLNQGRIFKNPVFNEIAQKNNISEAQVAIYWSLNKGYIPLFTTTKPDRMNEYIKTSTIPSPIKSEDFKRLDALDGGEFSHWHEECEPQKMIPINSLSQLFENKEETIKCYLFGLVPIGKIKKYKNGKKKYYLLGIPVLKLSPKNKK